MSDYRGKKCAVWGAARSGIAAANLLVELGADVCLSDNRPSAELTLDGLDGRVRLLGGGNVVGDAEILVPSPGIPPSNPELRRATASGVRLMGEIELAASVAKAPIVAITGTDGKSTTTEMIGSVVRGAGREAIVAGNIGDPFTRRVLEADEDAVLVIEVSAFQLWSCSRFRPDVAVVTNIAEDHAEYFDNDVAAYIRAKERILDDMVAPGAAVLRADDRVVSAFATPEGVDRVYFGPNIRPVGWGYDDGHLTKNGQPIMKGSELSVPGTHNISNALAALAAGSALGLDQHQMVSGLKTFRGLKHRFELVCERGGVTWFDDSKATNPHAAAAGLSSIKQPAIIITGGYDKGLSLAPFVQALESARHVITCGPTAERTEQEVQAFWGAQAPQVSRVQNMEQAVERAHAMSRPGEVVVLSPAASSFDAYQSYAHRGEVFQEAVLRLTRASNDAQL